MRVWAAVHWRLRETVINHALIHAAVCTSDVVGTAWQYWPNKLSLIGGPAIAAGSASRNATHAQVTSMSISDSATRTIKSHDHCYVWYILSREEKFRVTATRSANFTLFC
jgi:hypothetical protein